MRRLLPSRAAISVLALIRGWYYWPSVSCLSSLSLRDQDAFAIFDPRPVFALAEQLFPGRGTELSNAWRTRQFEYQWLRALSRSYADFRQATEDALMFSTEMLKLDLTPEKRDQLMDAYLRRRLAASVAFYRALGLRQIVSSPPDYARFECPVGGSTFSVHRTSEPLRDGGVVVYFEVEVSTPP